MKRSGTADLPLHGGRVPEWLSHRMMEMGRAIVTAIVEEYGQEEVLTRLSDPFWFQALGCVMGMDWHSSGITTSVMGALKRGINPIAKDLGLFVCGGRGKYSRRTPQELLEHSDRKGLRGDELVLASKLSAKVDNSCIQDGFNLYLHSFVVSDKGQWAVIQQGMNQETAKARRYHWHSASVRSFVSDPHTAIVGQNQGAIMNLSDSRAEKNRTGIVEFLCQHPDKQLKEIRHLVMGRNHQVTPAYVNSKRLGAVLAMAYEKQFKKFTDALMLKGVGPRTLQSLALVSEVIYGAPNRFQDPARFSFAHGGKDGAPFPVPLKVYDKSIQVLKDALRRAKIDRTDKMQSLEKLGLLTRAIGERFDPHADINKVINYEWKNSYKYGGRTVKSPVKPPQDKKGKIEQLSLFDEE
jgi:hypothetical protein